MGRYPADDPARDPGRDVGTGGYSIALVRPNLNILTIRKYSLEVLATHINWGLVVKCSNSYFSFLLKNPDSSRRGTSFAKENFLLFV